MAVHRSTLNAETKLSQVKELLASRKGSPEHRRLDPPEIELRWREYDRLTRELEESPGWFTLPGNPGGISYLNNFSYPSGNRNRHSNKDPNDETQRRTPQCQGPTQLPRNSSHASKS